MNRVLSDTESKLTKLSTSWDTLVQNIGAGISTVAVPAFDAINKQIDDRKSYGAGVERGAASGGDLRAMSLRHADLYRQLHPEASGRERMNAFKADLERYARPEPILARSRFAASAARQEARTDSLS